MTDLPKPFRKIINRTKLAKAEGYLADLNDKDSLVVVGTVARHRALSPCDKMYLIRGFCHCSITIFQIEEELRNR